MKIQRRTFLRETCYCGHQHQLPDDTVAVRAGLDYQYFQKALNVN